MKKKQERIPRKRYNFLSTYANLRAEKSPGTSPTTRLIPNARRRKTGIRIGIYLVKGFQVTGYGIPGFRVPGVRCVFVPLNMDLV